MGRPAIALILLQPVKCPYILRKPYGFEYPHVFTRGEYVRPVDGHVDADHAFYNKLLFIQLAVRQLGGQRLHKIAPDQRRIRNGRGFSHGDLRKVDDLKMPF